MRSKLPELDYGYKAAKKSKISISIGVFWMVKLEEFRDDSCMYVLMKNESEKETGSFTYICVCKRIKGKQIRYFLVYVPIARPFLSFPSPETTKEQNKQETNV